MQKTVREIAKQLGATFEGDGDTLIDSVAGIREAGPGQLSFIANAKYFADVEHTRASALIVPENAELKFRPIIRSAQPKLAFIKAMELFAPPSPPIVPGIDATAVLAHNVELGTDVYIGPNVVIEEGVQIGDHSIIYAGTYIGRGSKLGSQTRIYPNVTIWEKVSIGNRVTIHSGTVIGCDGFGYTETNGMQYKMPQLGTVLIEDDVEIGANVTIDRAALGRTWIKKGTKIDNLVHIAHNVVIGEHAIIVAQVGISGSVEIGDRVTLAGQAGIAGHLKIGSGTTVAAKSGVTKSIPPNVCVSGFPARLHRQEQRIQAHVQRLPKLVEKIKILEQRIEELEQKLSHQGAKSQRKKKQ
ncbi:MAG: UDP-3-O-(3-hydroxymyristoyl)glucosamine N-acyltransferase [bacterium]|nr:UDP-3-O-(3-hydroxymyristoyl)glucosamine N-acyltransferase [bacterium]